MRERERAGLSRSRFFSPATVENENIQGGREGGGIIIFKAIAGGSRRIIFGNSVAPPAPLLFPGKRDRETAAPGSLAIRKSRSRRNSMIAARGFPVEKEKVRRKESHASSNGNVGVVICLPR